MNLGGAVSHAQFEKRMQAYTQLNRFLIAFIDNVSCIICHLLGYLKKRVRDLILIFINLF